MGKAIYCDRCGKLFNTSEIDIKRGKLVGFWNEDIVVDLCPECRSGLENYVYGDDFKEFEKEQNKIYKKS